MGAETALVEADSRDYGLDLAVFEGIQVET